MATPSKKQPAKKAATKSTAKKTAPAKKPDAIKTPKVPAKKSAPLKASPEPAKKAVVSKTAIGVRKTKNGVTEPAAGTVARGIWDICDSLREKIGGPPARFEVREIAEKEYDHNSVSSQYFFWRKFHGIKKNAAKRFPKRGTFETSVPVVRTPRAKKAAAPAPVKAPKAAKAPAAAKPAKEAKAAKKAPSASAQGTAKPSASLSKPSGTAEKAPAKKAAKVAKKAAPKAPAASQPDLPGTAPAPAVSSRLAKASAEAETPPNVIIPPIEG